MKIIPSLAVLAALVGMLQGTPSLAADKEEGIALAIIYDTSGSMRDPVPDQNGGKTAKYVIANRALLSVANQLETFSTNTTSGASRKLNTALFVFQGQGAKQVIKFGPFDASAMREWANSFSTPGGNTPLGNALNAAGQCVLSSSLPHKHVLVITDGINTAGPQPSAILPRLKKQAEQNGVSLSVHFIAFDVAAQVFDPIRKQGATVVSASDEKQLNSQLDYILQRQILLEEEEKPSK